VAAICPKSWGGVPVQATSFLLSSLPSRLVDSSCGLGRDRLPAAKHFDAIYTVKQLYKIHIYVYCTTRYRNQRACRVQPLSAELILQITGHYFV